MNKKSFVLQDSVRVYPQDEIEQNIYNNRYFMIDPLSYKSWSDLRFFKSTDFLHINGMRDYSFKSIAGSKLSPESIISRNELYRRTLGPGPATNLIIKEGNFLLDTFSIVLFYIDPAGNVEILSLEKNQMSYSSDIYSNEEFQIRDMLNVSHNLFISDPISKIDSIYFLSKKKNFQKVFFVQITDENIIKNSFRLKLTDINDITLKKMASEIVRNPTLREARITISPRMDMQIKKRNKSDKDLETKRVVMAEKQLVIETMYSETKRTVDYQHLSDYDLFSLLLTFMYLGKRGIMMTDLSEKNFFYVKNSSPTAVAYKVGRYAYRFEGVKHFAVLNVLENNILFDKFYQSMTDDVVPYEIMQKYNLHRYKDKPFSYVVHSVFYKYRVRGKTFISKDISKPGEYVHINVFDLLYGVDDETTYIVTEKRMRERQFTIKNIDTVDTRVIAFKEIDKFHQFTYANLKLDVVIS
jgi:hypothetical protein